MVKDIKATIFFPLKLKNIFSLTTKKDQNDLRITLYEPICNSNAQVNYFLVKPLLLISSCIKGIQHSLTKFTIYYIYIYKHQTHMHRFYNHSWEYINEIKSEILKNNMQHNLEKIPMDLFKYIYQIPFQFLQHALRDSWLFKAESLL